jgi:hypothetical protein
MGGGKNKAGMFVIYGNSRRYTKIDECKCIL